MRLGISTVVALGCTTSPAPLASPVPIVRPLVIGETFTVVAIHYDPLPDQQHNTIFPVAALRAFRDLFAKPHPRDPPRCS